MSVESLAGRLWRAVLKERATGEMSVADVRPAFALALEMLEREGKIPGEAPELLELGEGGALAELRAELGKLSGDTAIAFRCETPGFRTGRRDGLRSAIEALNRIAAKHRPSLGRRANDLQEALRLQGVHLGPDATEAVVKALASLEGDAS